MAGQVIRPATMRRPTVPAVFFSLIWYSSETFPSSTLASRLVKCDAFTMQDEIRRSETISTVR